MKERCRLLLLLPQLKQGGAEQVVFNLVAGLDRTSFQPSIAWFHGRCHPPFSDIRDIPMHFLDKKPGFDPKVIWKLARIIFSHKIDIINAHHFMPLVYAYPACRITRCRLTHTEHSIFDTQHDRPFRKRMAGFMYRTTDAVIGVSPEVSEVFKDTYRVPAQRLHTIVNGVDLQKFKSAEKDPHLLSQLNISNLFTIGMTGNFRTVKNHVLLIQAFSRINDLFPKTQLVLVGQGFPNDPENSEPVIREAIQDNGLSGKVHFLGYRPDVHRILPCFDIFCLTSFREGLPLSLLEAMACELPVIGTHVPGIRMVIAHGFNGLLVKDNNVDELSEALLYLLQHPNERKKIGTEARRSIAANFNGIQSVQNHESLFASVTQ